jgi:hypothetical protein
VDGSDVLAKKADERKLHAAEKEDTNDHRSNSNGEALPEQELGFRVRYGSARVAGLERGRNSGFAGFILSPDGAEFLGIIIHEKIRLFVFCEPVRSRSMTLFRCFLRLPRSWIDVS